MALGLRLLLWLRLRFWYLHLEHLVLFIVLAFIRFFGLVLFLFVVVVILVIVILFLLLLQLLKVVVSVVDHGVSVHLCVFRSGPIFMDVEVGGRTTAGSGGHVCER